MFAMIEIPHQTPANLYFYGNVDELLEYADNYAMKHDANESSWKYHAIEFPTKDDAIELVTEDLHGYLLIESYEDIRRAEQYTGHQELRVRSFVEELCEEFSKEAGMPNLYELKQLSDRLAALMKNPEPGLSTWKHAIENVLIDISEFTPQT